MYTYIVTCNDGSLYTGWTKDLNSRIRRHNQGCGSKYTNSRRPVETVYFEIHETKEEAQKREYAIKQLTRREKLRLVKTFSISDTLKEISVFRCYGIVSAPEIVSIRTQVFVEEQGFQNEFDDIDAKAFHVLLYLNGRPAATGRTFPKDGEDGVWILGRIAVLKEYRGMHLGEKLVCSLENVVKRSKGSTIELTAQLQAKGFYEKLGYKAYGSLCYDEYCPHIQMRKAGSIKQKLIFDA